MAEQRQEELNRILDEYERRARTIPVDYYLPTQPGELFMSQERTRAMYSLLRKEAFVPLSDKRILEVGCGTGGLLAVFEAGGAKRENLSAIELNPARAAVALSRFSAFRNDRGAVVAPGADIRIGDASQLPWKDGSFDVVVQSTVFTSILDPAMRRTVAAEMMRVTRADGAILWYDFFVDNPWNRAVRGVPDTEIRALFPGWRLRRERVTLMPPLARRIVPISWTVAHLLSKLRLLNTHYVGILRRQ